MRICYCKLLNNVGKLTQNTISLENFELLLENEAVTVDQRVIELCIKRDGRRLDLHSGNREIYYLIAKQSGFSFCRSTRYVMKVFRRVGNGVSLH